MSESPSTFVQPLWLWLLVLLPFLAVLFLTSERQRAQALGRLIAARLQARLAGSVSVAKRRVAFALLLAGLAFCIVALARPRWGFAFEQVMGRGRDIIIAVDTSRSMLAQDLEPSRLARAKLAAQDLLSNLDGDRVGLIAFAGTAFLQAPLTPDYEAVRDSLEELDTEIIPQGGTNLSAAIAAADGAFGKGESTHRALILFTDGEDLQEDALEAAKKHKDTFRIFTIGLGTPGGAPLIVPSRRGKEMVRDEQGNVVTSRLDEKRLREVAEAGGGFYIHLQNGPAEMRQLFRDGLSNMTEKDTDQRMNKIAIERYQWPLSLGLLCIAASVLLGERRRQLLRVTILAASMFLVPQNAEARGLMGRLIDKVLHPETAKEDAAPKPPPDELKALEEERKRRPNTPQLDYNVGCAAFKSGDYDKAAASFSNALGTGDAALKSKAAYNLANTLAHRGAAEKEKEPKLAEWKSAVQNYDHALALDPSNANAKENRDIVSKAIAELEKPEEKKDQQKKDEQKKDDQKKDQEKKDDQKKDGDSKDGEQKGDSKDGEKKDGEKKDGNDSQQEKKDGEQSDKKQGEPKDQKKNVDKQKDDEKKDPQAQPKAGEHEKPKTGELKSAGEQQPGDKDAQQSEAAEAAAAAREGRMTEKDAKQLLESLRKNDVILPPLKLLEERQTPRRVQKNW